MTPERRREQLVDVTLRLLREHGMGVTTRQIAEAAGIAEGTIFRVVETKEELVDAAIMRAFEPRALVERLQEIDGGQPLRDRLLVMVSVLQQRFRATFFLMQKVGLVRPPQHLHDSAEADAWRAEQHRLMVAVVGSDADRLRVPVDQFCHTLRLLTFAGSHQTIADGHLLSPEEIVDTALYGLLDASGSDSDTHTAPALDATAHAKVDS